MKIEFWIWEWSCVNYCHLQVGRKFHPVIRVKRSGTFMTIFHDQSHTLVFVAVTCWLILYDFFQMFWRFIAVILIGLNILLLAKIYKGPLHKIYLRLHCAAVQFHMFKVKMKASKFRKNKWSRQIKIKKVKFSHYTNSTHQSHIGASLSWLCSKG